MRRGKFTVADGQYKGSPVFTVEMDGLEYLADVEKFLEPSGRWIDRKGASSNEWMDASGQSGETFIEEVRSGGIQRHAAMIEHAKSGLEVPAFRLYGPAVGLSVGPGVPIIPAVLAGQPEHSLTITEQADTTTPIRILFDRASSAGVEARMVETAGATVAAVLEIIQASRPVEVYAIASVEAKHDIGAKSLGRARAAVSLRIRLSSHPSTAEIGLYLVGLGVIRRGLYAIAVRDFGYDGLWPFNQYKSHGSLVCMDDLAGPTDIVIPPLHLSHQLVREPKQWAEQAIEKAFSTVGDY